MHIDLIISGGFRANVVALALTDLLDVCIMRVSHVNLIISRLEVFYVRF